MSIIQFSGIDRVFVKNKWRDLAYARDGRFLKLVTIYLTRYIDDGGLIRLFAER